mgnify:CR=1 FL=1
MAYTLRLPDALDAAARAKADYLGISLNALLCVALDAYLRGPSELPTPQTGAAPGGPNPSKTSIPEPERNEPGPSGQLGKSEPAKLTRAERKRLHDQRKHKSRP